MIGLRREGLTVLRNGFYDIIDADTLQHIQSQEVSWCELQLLVNGIPEVDVEALKASTVYRNGGAELEKVKWFFQVLEGWQRYVRQTHDLHRLPILLQLSSAHPVRGCRTREDD
jgi:hypothetical protein